MAPPSYHQGLKPHRNPSVERQKLFISALMKSVILAGGSGLIGTQLRQVLVQQGYHVRVLSRRAHPDQKNLEFGRWDPAQGELHDAWIEEADYIINLSGAGVADRRWTAAFKEELLTSRTESTKTLVEAVHRLRPDLEKFINASAIGYYGYDRGDEILTENAAPGDGFLANLTRRWEAAAQAYPDAERLALMRIGIVLTPRGGALQKMLTPIRLGVGSPLASGRQWLSWIHIEDLINMFIQVMQDDQAHGPYNATAPMPERNRDFMKKLARQLNRPFIFPNVPDWALQAALGQFADTVIGGLRVLPVRMQEEAFSFKFPQLEGALKDLFD